MTLSRDLVRRFGALRRVPLPPAIAARAALHLRDALGVGLAASTATVGQPYRRLAAEAMGGRSTLLGHDGPGPAELAALVNGGLIHCLEYDDTHTASIVHGSALAAAACLATAEEAAADGPALLASFALTWEVLIRIGLAAPGGFQARGFHVTSVAGALAAALAASDLMDLPEDQAVAAIGIALSQASGVFEFLSNGSSVKSLHPGWAAHAGIMAAKLAGAGMTGPETALEGRWGLFRHFAGNEEAAGRFGDSLADLGTHWHLPGVAGKFQPCCHYLHPFIEAAGEIAARGIAAEDVQRLLCRVPPGEAAIICEPWDAKLAPRDGHAMRWSLPLAVAIRMVEGAVGLDTFERPPSGAALAFARRIDWEPMTEARFPERFEAEIRCELRDGRAVTVRVEDADGNRSRPATPERFETKFRDNAGRALAPDAVQAVAEAFTARAGGPDLAGLGAALRTLKGRGVSLGRL